MSVQYTLTFTNQSSTAGAACLYQTAPAGLQSLAWLVRNVDAAGGTQPSATFTWALDYGFMFSEPSSGTGFAEVVPVDPSGAQNEVTFTASPSGYAFDDATAGPAGTLTINQSCNVGYAMAGAPCFAAPPQLTYTPPAAPSYMLAFGDFTAGEFMPASPSSSAPAPVAVTFPSGVYAMTAVLSASNGLTVSQPSSSSGTSPASSSSSTSGSSA